MNPPPAPEPADPTGCGSDNPPLAQVTAAGARAMDRFAAEELGLPTLVLMENAAVNLAGLVLDLLAEAVELDDDRFRVGILAGGGNNGGDGWALARHLAGFGVAATVFAAKPVEGLSGDAAINAAVAVRCGIPVVPCADAEAAEALAATLTRQHVLVDALLGTGLSGPPRPGVGGVIRVVNRLSPRPVVLAVDLPSGLDADAGEPAEPTVRADVTATFVAPKAGFDASAAAPFLGRVVVCGIGVPESVLARAL